MAEAAIAGDIETDVLARDRCVYYRSSSDVGWAEPRHQDVDVFARESRLEDMELPGARGFRATAQSRIAQGCKYWITPDMSGALGISGEAGSFNLGYGATVAKNAICLIGMHYVYVTMPEDGATAFFEDAESVQAQLDRYFASRGLEQRELRGGLLTFVNNSALRRETAIDYTLWAVREYRSDDVMAAAIDLLTQGGAPLARSALERALERYANEADDDVVYAAAMAVGRTDHEALFKALAQSHDVALREAAVELLASDPSEESKQELTRLAQTDASDLIRELAQEALSDLEQ